MGDDVRPHARREGEGEGSSCGLHSTAFDIQNGRRKKRYELVRAQASRYLPLEPSRCYESEEDNNAAGGSLVARHKILLLLAVNRR